MEIAVQLSEGDIARIADAVAARLASSPAGGSDAGKLLWTEAEAAAALAISLPHLKRLRSRGYVRAASQEKPIRYDREALEAAKRFLTDN